MDISPYVFLLAISAFICGIFSVISLRYRASRAGREFMFLLVSMSWWSSMNAMESMVTSLEYKLFFSTITYIGSQTAPVLFFLFSLRYTQMDKLISRKIKFFLFLLPFCSFVVAVTNPIHHLLWPDISLSTSAFAGNYVIYSHGPWYWIEIIYSYTLLFIGIFALARASFRYPVFYTLQCRLILAASLIPVTGNVTYTLFFQTLEGIDPTPFLFSITGVFIAISMYWFRFLDLVPIAREQVLESMEEGMVVLDNQERIIDLNPAALRLFLISGEFIGCPVSEVFTWWKGKKSPETSGIISISGTDPLIRWFFWSVSDIKSDDGIIRGKCLIFRDVSRQHEMEERLQIQAEELKKLTNDLSFAHERLQLMTSITRHDILNMITVQRGYLEMARDVKKPEILDKAIEKSYDAALRIQDLIAFTGTYQEIGLKKPEWISITRVIDRAISSFSLVEIAISNLIPENIELLSDPLIEKVIFVLVDNSIRHGTCVSNIRFSAEKDENLILIYEDDGAGVLDKEKEIIFKRGMGRNTGLGLYLAREILKVNGYSIRECGISGNGARFEIFIPEGMWRETDYK